MAFCFSMIARLRPAAFRPRHFLPCRLFSSNSTMLRPRIAVVGVGGAGGNTVDHIINRRLDGVDMFVANTDAQALVRSRCPELHKIQLGKALTRGLGAGAVPDVGRRAAEDDTEYISHQLAGSQMVFVTAGMGGGTGTGAAPVISRIARSMGMLTVGIVTKPFDFEGKKRMRQANEGLVQLQREVDTLIIVPNQRVLGMAGEPKSFPESFAMVNDVLYEGIKAVTDVIVKPGLINLDFADVRTITAGPGWGLMGTGSATGKDRAAEAAMAALTNPLLDHSAQQQATGVLVSIAGGSDLGLLEVDRIVNTINEHVGGDANVIFGATADSSLEGSVHVSLIVTGPWEADEAAAAESGGGNPQDEAADADAVARTVGPRRPKRAAVSKKDAKKAEQKKQGFYWW
eukprot:TRINITY_DN8494_c0_g1_i1.p1 TRINITY_DN8494_c0_g1~~TRINITY_DN8494_c0_g1_i1.p1  ORF type:complete len:401 (-),score=132.41 TRINITY_DN8494_c0_g1_i1:63-1265(-)